MHLKNYCHSVLNIMNRLPLEIIRSIYFCIPTQSLNACSLVCIKWYTMFNLILYNTINIYLEAGLELFKSSIAAPESRVNGYVRHVGYKQRSQCLSIFSIDGQEILALLLLLARRAYSLWFIYMSQLE